MTVKWVALWLISIGLASFVAAVSKDSTASFDDGSFLWVIFLALGGAMMVIVGISILAVAIFRSI